MAFDFNGTTDRVDWANAGTLYNQAKTIAALVYVETMDGTGTARYVFCTHTASDTAFGVLFGYSGTGTISLFVNGSTFFRRSSSTTFSTGSWVHLCATHDGSTTATNASLYINASEVAYDGASNQNGVTLTSDAGSTWSIGGRKFDDARNTDARIAHVGVWNRVLGAAAISSLASGVSPLHPQFANLRLFAPPLTRVAFDPQSGGAGTLDGTSVIESPRIFMPKRTRNVYVPDAAVATTVKPRSLLTLGVGC